jgi:hypothetical protein
MCLSAVYDKSEIKKLPETITMWRVFYRGLGRQLFSMQWWHPFKLGVNVEPQPTEENIDDNCKGFHCFLSRKDARKVRNLKDQGWRKFTVRKVIVNRKDVAVLGLTTWNFGTSPIFKTETAVVKKMNILPTSEGR